MLLALDTSLNHCSVAIARDGAILSGQSQPMQRGQAEALTPMIAAVLSSAGVQKADLTCIAVTTGPGSFAGVRVGVAAARGLALGLSIPAIGFSVFEVLAHGAQCKLGKHPVFSAIPARGGQLFTQTFDAGGDPRASAVTMANDKAGKAIEGWAGPLAFYGSPQDYDEIADLSDRQCCFFTDLAQRLALCAAATQDLEKRSPPSPLYMRPPDAKRPQKEGFKRLAG